MQAASRIRLAASLPNALYDLKVAGHVDPAKTRAAVQNILEDGLQLEVTRYQIATAAPVLTETSESERLIQPTASTEGILPDDKNRTVHAANASADALA